ncbi:MAG: flagellar export chaperone FliS [Planctomycetota bacterium]|jgi:flagellar protein FliS
MSQPNAAEIYRRNSILTASPEKLIKMLYDAAIRNLEISRMALSDPARTHSAEVGECLGKALSIIGELKTALDRERGGEIAENLDSLYEYSMDQVSQANINRSAEPVETTLQVLRTLKEGWDAVIPH